MDKKEEQFAIGYLRVPDINDERDIHEKITALREYCAEQGIRLPLVVSDSVKSSENFKGSGWRDIENTLAHAEGRIQSVVVLYSNTLTRDLGLQLLKERELKDKFGVTIEFADGHRQQKDQSRNLFLN